MRLLSILGILAVLLPAGAAADTRLLRFPDLYGDKLVFTHGGDE